MNRGPRCKKSENYYVMNNGRNYLRYYRVSRAILGRPPRTIAYFWKRCCGSCARVHHGETCLQNWATGTRHTRGSNGGACTSTRCWCQKKEGPQAIGRSRGGWTSKIHVVVDALGSPVRWLLTGGEVADITQAKSLLEGLKADAVLADKGYDADALIDSIQVAGATAVIPPRRNRVVQRSYDRHLYKERNLVERFFNRIKQFRRIATRYEKLARNYLSFLNLVCTYIWIT